MCKLIKHIKNRQYEFSSKQIMKLIKSQKNDAVGIEINEISFRSLLRALRKLPSFEIEKCNYNFMNDDAFVSFLYKGIKFEILTPLSDYWIDRPEGCPPSKWKYQMAGY